MEYTIKELYERALASEDKGLVITWLTSQLRSFLAGKELRVDGRVVSPAAGTRVMADLQDLLKKYKKESEELWNSKTTLQLSASLEEKKEETDGGEAQADSTSENQEAEGSTQPGRRRSRENLS